MDVQTTPTVPHAEYFPPLPSPRGASRWLAEIDEDRRELFRFWPVIQNMVVQELRVRYHRSMLGFVWTLLNPILMMATLTLVFSQVFVMPRKDYTLHLFAGMVPWGFLNGALNDCAFCIISNEGLIRKIYLPKLVFPVSKVLINLSTFLLSLVALFVLLKPLGAQFTWPLLLLPVVTALFFAFSLGLG